MLNSKNEHLIPSKKQLKIVVLGDKTVGKSSLIRKYCYNEFSRIYVPTIGADFFIKNTQIVENNQIAVRFTDVNGVEMNKQIFETYLYKANIIILVYDISNSLSFESIKLWYQNVKEVMGNKGEIAEIAIFGNKCDLEHQRTVQINQTKQFIEDNHFLHYLTSAKTGENVQSSFMEIIAHYFHISLTRIEKEKQKTIVKAELIPNPPAMIVPHRKWINSTNKVKVKNKINAKQVKKIDKKIEKNNKKSYEKSCSIQ